MTEDNQDQHPPLYGHRKVFGRRKGKALRASQRKLIDEFLPAVSVPGVYPPDDPGRQPVELEELFGRAAPVWLEIGFGGGEHLAHQAGLHADVGFIGCEPFINGVAMALGRIRKAGLGNVRVHAGDARDLLELLPENCLERVFLLYPDPWPKSRHHGRRFMNPDNLALLRRVMKPGAHLRLATDIPAYVEHALEAVAAAEGFETVEPERPDWSVAWPDWPGTRYEAKALRQGRRGHYLTFVRV